MSSKIDFRKLTTGTRLKTKGGKICSVINVYGAEYADILKDDGSIVAASIDELWSIDITPEILICFGFKIKYGGSWEYSMDHMGEYTLYVTETGFFKERPWMLTIVDTITEEVIGSGPVANVHELQGLVYNVTELPLEPVGTLETTLKLMEERRPVMDIFEDLMDIVDEHISKEDPWWDIFGKVINFDGGSDYTQFNYEYRYDYVEYMDEFLTKPEDYDNFKDIWELNEDYIIQEYYGGTMPDLEELYMQNLMMIVVYACCTEEPEPYQWIIKSLE